MKKVKRGLKRIAAFTLAVILAGTMVDYSTLTVSAAEGTQSESCEHHGEHNADCGYAEVIAGSPCTHVHDETCGYDTVSGNEACNHEHDETCGYVEEVQGNACGFTCEICEKENAVQTDTATPSVTFATSRELTGTLKAASVAVEATGLTVTGGTEGVDYIWNTENGSNEMILNYENQSVTCYQALVILTDTPLTITGSSAAGTNWTGEYRCGQVVFVKSGVTANVTLSDAHISSTDETISPITIAGNASLNLTLKGENTLVSKKDVYLETVPAIYVCPYAALTVTGESTGSLNASGVGSSAVIGQSDGDGVYRTGDITINGGILNISNYAETSYGSWGRTGVAIGGSSGGSTVFGTITINGGILTLYSEYGSAIGQGWCNLPATTQGGYVVINGGTIKAVTGDTGSDGIGRCNESLSRGDVTIYGGNVDTNVVNMRPLNSETNSLLYKTAITLSGAGADASVTRVTYYDGTGKKTTYQVTDMKTFENGQLYVWLPADVTITDVTAGGVTYYGCFTTQSNDFGQVTFYPASGAYKVTIGTQKNAQVQLSRSTGLKAGDEVLVYVTPTTGNMLLGLSLNTSSASVEPVGFTGFTDLGDGRYAFVMPAASQYLHANAGTITDTGDFVVSNAVGCNYAYNNGVLTFTGTGSATVSMKEGVTSTKHRIVLGEGAQVELTLRDVTINTNNYNSAVDMLATAGNCVLISEGTNRLTSLGTVIHKAYHESTTLTFRGTGSLEVYHAGNKGGYDSAAIGGVEKESAKGLIFESGTVSARVHEWSGASAIGSRGGNSAGVSSEITISGGRITAAAAEDARYSLQGIGSASGGGTTPDKITITGGTVEATGGKGGTQRFGAISSQYGNVIITGGSVKMNDRGTKNGPKQPTNGSANVYLTTITVGSGDSLSKNAKVKSLTITGGYNYGINDMYTDSEGKLYLWLPANTVVTGVETVNGSYTGTCTTNTTDGGTAKCDGDAAATFALKSGTTFFVPVEDIVLSSEPVIGTDFDLSGATVSPARATNKTITWSVVNGGTTGATIQNNKLKLTAPGTVTIKATIANGTAQGSAFTKTFTFTVKQNSSLGADETKDVTYGNRLILPVTIQDSQGTADTAARGTVVLSAKQDGSDPIATAQVQQGKATLVYDTAGKKLSIGENTLYVVYQGDTGRYGSSKTVSVELSKKPLTVDVTFKEKTYNAQDDVSIKTAKLSGAEDGDNVVLGDYSQITATASAKNAGTRDVTLSDGFTISGADLGYYSFSQPGNLQIEIQKAPLTVSANNYTITYGDEPGNSGVSYSGFVSNEDKNVLEGTLAYDYTYTQYGDAGNTYEIKPFGLTSENYDIQFKSGTLTVNPKKIGIQWGDVTEFTYDSKEHAPTAAATGAVNGEELTLTVDGAQTDANVKTGTSPYTAKVTKILLGDAETKNYVLPSEVTKEFTIVPKSIAGAVITLKSSEIPYDGQEHSPEITKVTIDKLTLSASDYVQTEASEGTKISYGTYTIEIEGKGNYTGKATAVWKIIDTVAPTGDITISDNSVKKKLHEVTFGLFFNKTQEVLITAEDADSGVKEIGYYISNTNLCEGKTEAEALSIVKAIAETEWETIAADNGKFSIDPDQKYVIYAKLTDNSDNTVYLSSDGLVLDAVAPVIGGVSGDSTFYGNTAFTVMDDYLDTVTLDESSVTLVEGKYVITADDKTHTLIAKDKAGNRAEVSFTVVSIASIDDEIQELDESNVTLSDKKAVQQVLDKVKELEDSGKDFTEEEKEQLAGIKENAETLEEKIESIERVESVIFEIEKLPEADKVNTDDEDAVADVQKIVDAYDKLTDEEKLQVGEDNLNKLEKVQAKLCDYAIIKGTDGSYTKGSKDVLEFTANGAYSKFTGIKVDKADVSKEHYTAEAGSTVVTLKTSYLETLTNGKHELTVVYTDGEADGNFEVKEKSAGGKSDGGEEAVDEKSEGSEGKIADEKCRDNTAKDTATQSGNEDAGTDGGPSAGAEGNATESNDKKPDQQAENEPESNSESGTDAEKTMSVDDNSTAGAGDDWGNWCVVVVGAIIILIGLGIFFVVKKKKEDEVKA